MKRTGVGLVWVALLAACTPSVPFEESGGVALPGSENNFALIGGAFSLSPDGDWLFSTNHDPVKRAVGHPVDEAYLYAIADRGRYPIGLSESAAALIEKEGLIAESGCWRASRLFVSTPFLRSIAVDTRSGPPFAWTPGGKPPCRRDAADAAGLISVQRGRDGDVTVRTRDGRLLDEYSAVPLVGTEVLVSEVRRSGDGRWLSWSVTRPLGSFVGNSQAWVADLRRDRLTPVLLTSPAGTVRFTVDSQRVLIHTRARDDRAWVIAAWDLEGLQR